MSSYNDDGPPLVEPPLRVYSFYVRFVGKSMIETIEIEAHSTAEAYSEMPDGIVYWEFISAQEKQ